MNKTVFKTLEVTGAIALLALVFLIVDFTFFMWLIIAIAGVIGIGELISIKQTNKTISQLFYELKGWRKNTGIIGLGLLFIYLILHLYFGI
jgi:hypothetical protein